MPGDYSRLTFDPRQDRAMVFKQQGRVDLDADFNELAAMLERRLRVETYDFTGPAVVPASLPDSFKIAAGAGGLTIAPGRIYVDGLLAENHGDRKTGKPTYEPVWGEPGWDQPTALADQPYIGAGSTAAAPTPALVYVDVWQREVTSAEEADLVEPALGVDTCTRIQTAWQVKLLGAEKGRDCSYDWGTDPGWLAATQPSSGLLSSDANKAPAPTDPCAVGLIGGYRGLENRLYRVEIHDGGGAGQATAKWSRDNGAVAVRITGAITTPGGSRPVIPVERLGRDSVLRFNVNDWVEVLDDSREFDGKPGVIGQVIDTDSVNNTVTLAGPLSGLSTIDTSRNPRLRRWDQTTGLTAGVIPITLVPQTIQLEDGVEVTLDLAAADPNAPAGAPAPAFKTGDWWVFTARAASASVEQLEQAPPRGIRHHYARLAIVDGTTVASDCRVIFPGDCECEGGSCECDACVTPQSHKSGLQTIQMAVDKVGPKGGRICLAPGRYELTLPLKIVAAWSLTIVGAGAATLLTYVGRGVAIQVIGSVAVTLEHFALAAAHDQGYDGQHHLLDQPLVGIGLDNTIDCYVRECFVVIGFVPGAVRSASAGGVDATSNLSRPSFSFGQGDVGIGLLGIALRTRLIENVIFASTAIGDLTGARSNVAVGEAAGGYPPTTGAYTTTALPSSYSAVYSSHGPTSYLLSADLAIVDNLLLALRVGVDFGAATSAAKGESQWTHLSGPTIHMAQTRIADNLIVGTAVAGLVLLGLSAQEVPPASSPPAPTPTGGVSVPGTPEPCLQIEGSKKALTGLATGSPTLVAGGLVIGSAIGADMITVRGNVLLTEGCGIIASGDGLIADQNHIVGPAQEASRPMIGVRLAAERSSYGGRATVSGNWIRQFRQGGIVAAGRMMALTISGNRISSTGEVGVDTSVGFVSDVAVTGNTIQALTQDSRQQNDVTAIKLGYGSTARVTDNLISAIGSEAWNGGRCVGISAIGHFWTTIRGNEIVNVGPDGGHDGYVIGIAGEATGTLEIHANIVDLGRNGSPSLDIPLWVEPLPGSRAVGVIWSQVVLNQLNFGTLFDRRLGLGQPDLGVIANVLAAGGASSVVCINTSANVTFAENRCIRPAGDERPQYSVVTIDTPDALIVSANRVEGNGSEATPLVDLQPNQSDGSTPVTVLGNVATGGPINLYGSGLSNPWLPLNALN